MPQGAYPLPVATGGGGATFSAGISTGGNTLGTTGLVSAQLLVIGGNNITLSQSVNGGSASLTISALNQSAQTQDRFDATLAGNTSGALALVSSGTLTLAGGNNITLSQAGNAVTISGPNTVAQSVQTQGFSNTLGMSNLGNSSGTSGAVSGTGLQLLFAGGNNITLSQSLNGASGTITISAFTQSVQTQGMVQSLNGSSSQLSISAGNLISISNHASTIDVINVLSSSAIAQPVSSASAAGTLSSRFALADHAHAGVFSAGVSNVGNTSGNTTVVPGQLILAGGNNVTLSVGTAAGNLMTVTISAGAAAAQAFSAGMSTNGNTSGTTGLVGSQMIFIGGNNVTLSQSVNGASASLTISAFTQSAESQSFGMSNVGNTSGTTGIASGAQVQFVLYGNNNVTLSQSLNGASGTITISAGPPPMSRWANMGAILASGATVALIARNSSINIFPLCIPQFFAGNMSVSTVLIGMSGNQTGTQSTGSFTETYAFGIYTEVNSTQLSLLYQASSTWGTGAAAANITASINGARYFSLHSSIFSNNTGGTVNPSFVFGSRYYGAISNRTSGELKAISWQGARFGGTDQRSGTMGVSIAATNTTMGWWPFAGVYSVTTAALPASFANSDISKPANLANFLPMIIFENLVSSF